MSKTAPAVAADDTENEVSGNPLLQPPPNDAVPDLRMATPHHCAIVRRAVEDRAEALKKLAGKADDEGYPREARIFSGDALALTEDILPQLERQVELALDPDELPHAIKNQLHPLVFRHVPVTEDEGEVDHRKLMLEALGERITAFAVDIAARAYTAGLRARKDEPELFAFAAVEALKG